MIGIILLVTTHYGSRRRQYMIHVQSVGVFQTVEATVYGKLLDLRAHHMTVQTKALISVSAVHPPLGIQLRVLAATAMAVWTMSAAPASIGQFLLAATSHAACTSSAMAVSVRRTASVGRTASQSVVSKNQNNSIRVSMCPSLARACGHGL